MICSRPAKPGAAPAKSSSAGTPLTENSTGCNGVGNGGAARGAVFALKDQGSEVVVSGRNFDRARRLARAAGVGALEFQRLSDDYFDVLINATPVGMSPKSNANIFPGRVPADVVFD